MTVDAAFLALTLSGAAFVFSAVALILVALAPPGGRGRPPAEPSLRDRLEMRRVRSVGDIFPGES